MSRDQGMCLGVRSTQGGDVMTDWPTLVLIFSLGALAGSIYATLVLTRRRR